MAELDQIQQLLAVARRSERKAVTAGQRGADALLWALVPLYLLRKSAGPLPLNGGDIARFWRLNGIMRHRWNITSALWRHIGYARHLARPQPFDGWVITPNGVKYVEMAIAGVCLRHLGCRGALRCRQKAVDHG